MDLSINDQNALEIYALWEDRVNYFGTDILPNSAVRRAFRQGKKLMKEAIAMKNRNTKKYTQWYPGEYDALAIAYHTHGGDNKQCLIDFRNYSDRHTDYAVDLAIQSCKYLDQTVNDVKGLHDYANGLLLALQAIDKNRYRGRR